jgi:hypothetical protein
MTLGFLQTPISVIPMVPVWFPSSPMRAFQAKVANAKYSLTRAAILPAADRGDAKWQATQIVSQGHEYGPTPPRQSVSIIFK